MSETIKHLDQIENTKNIIEKFYILIMTINKLRMEMLSVKKVNIDEKEYLELQNAILIIVLIFAKLENPFAHLFMIEDFISLCHEYDTEKDIILKYKVFLLI